MRIVLDTNELVRAMIRPASLSSFTMSWEARRFRVICSRSLLDEYERVLNYPNLASFLVPESMRAFRDYLMSEIEVIDIPHIVHVCRDPSDDKVIETAIMGRANYLLTKDNDLRSPPIVQLLQRAGVEVITVEEFIKILDRL